MIPDDPDPQPWWYNDEPQGFTRSYEVGCIVLLYAGAIVLGVIAGLGIAQ